MSKLTRDDILKLAHLSQLELSEEELESYGKDLNAILTYVEVLQAVDTSGLEPTYQVTGLQNVERDDDVNPALDIGRDALLSNAPNQTQGQFKVKRVLN